MILTWPTLQENHWHYLLGSAVFVVMAFWLRRELTAKRFLTLFESENSLSLRLVLAAAVVVFTLLMQAAGRLNVPATEVNYTFAALLLGLGIAKLVGKAFAERPADTTVVSKKTDIKAESVNVKPEAFDPEAPEHRPLAGYSDRPSRPNPYAE
ncbi:hypothetical protein D0N36_19275 [Hymenobacter lapidiphilus]|uniref:hypothetical protein n=1 Tax=Hymenobacter sp. CCM 8763 TaxID=2303334 RepID=UPI000E3539F6|nr:hypothetical protein [Hymenobacter sp. CCM 8763]RFP63483.1 hypothetical protein D0N36_19275 [Hymenobacter sp. CCM 8763]